MGYAKQGGGEGEVQLKIWLKERTLSAADRS